MLREKDDDEIDVHRKTSSSSSAPSSPPAQMPFQVDLSLSLRSITTTATVTPAFPMALKKLLLLHHHRRHNRRSKLIFPFLSGRSPPSPPSHRPFHGSQKTGMRSDDVKAIVSTVLRLQLSNQQLALSFQMEFTQKRGFKVQPIATTIPDMTRAAPAGKKTLRKGSVILTGASSGLDLATAKSLAATGKWHVIMACRDFLKVERAAKSAGCE